MPTELDTKLAPCPFCGGKPESEPWHGGAPTKVLISCSNAGYGDEDGGCSVGPQVTGETPEEAASAWNRRSSLPQPAQAVRALEDMAWECDMWPAWLHAIVDKANEVADRLDMSAEQAQAYAILSALTPSPPSVVTEATPSYSGWRSIDTAPEDEHVILSTSGGFVGEAIMLTDEDTGRQKWAWALGPVHPNHIPYGWKHLPEALNAPVASDLRPDGFDGPTGAE